MGIRHENKRSIVFASPKILNADLRAMLSQIDATERVYQRPVSLQEIVYRGTGRKMRVTDERVNKTRRQIEQVPQEFLNYDSKTERYSLSAQGKLEHRTEIMPDIFPGKQETGRPRIRPALIRVGIHYPTATYKKA